LYDINGDGHISKEEFKKIMSSFLKFKGSLTMFSGKTYNDIDEICEEFFKVMDADGDGEITFNDYKQGALKNPDIMQGLSII
jgi:Ca2+-binding EF-hand superfamily protein